MAAEESTAVATESNDNAVDPPFNNINADNPNTNENNNENSDDVGFLQTKCSLLQNQLAFLRSQQKQKKEQRKKEKGEIVSTFKSMKGYIDHLERENKQYKTLLTPGVADVDEVVIILRQRLLTMQRENEQLKQRERSLATKCQSLQDQNTRLQEEVSRGKDTEAQLRDQVEKYEQVVDRVPVIGTPNGGANFHKHASMSVMADASEDGSRTGTIDDELYGNETIIKEDMFGKVVDHTPIILTPGNNKKGDTRPNKSSSSASAISFSDTVFGVTDRAELASIADLDEEEDDEDGQDDGGEEWAGSVAADNISLRLDIIDEKKLVDQVPSVHKKPKTRTRKYGASSVVVVPDVSVASGSRMDDNTVGDDDNLFGKMVDQTPDLTLPYQLKKAGSSVSFRDHLEDDTVLGVTEKQEIESVARQDDDVSSHGNATVDDDETATRDGLSITGPSDISVKLNVAEEKNLVDHVPRRKPNRQQRDASVIALADNYSTASPMDDMVAELDGTGVGGKDSNAFGPIVDQLPNLSNAPKSSKSAATSVVTQNSFFTDLNDDYDRDADDTLGPAPTAGDADWELSREDSKGGSISVPVTKHLVDHVPKRKRNPSDLSSIRAYAGDNMDNMSQVDTIAEDEEMEFGPIVDQTPFSATKSTSVTGSVRSGQVSVAGSTMAVGGGDTNQDYDMDTVQDTFMDTGTIASIAEEEDNVSTEENVVDHVPSLHRKKRSFGGGGGGVDESVRVVIDPNETMSQVDTIAEDGILDNFGPIVDHTPQIGGGGGGGGARSVAASTAAVVDDTRTEGDLESMALHTSVATDIAETMADSERFIPLAGEEEEEDEKHLVDHVPKEENRPSVGGSVRVVLDHAETLSQVDTVAEEERVAFGPIVDHTPAFSARSVGRSVGASMISVGSNDDSTSIQDNTTVGIGVGGSVGGGDDIGNLLDDNSAPAYTPSANEDKKLVDHVPSTSFPKSGDVSVMVQADPLDAVFEVDDETSNGNVRTDRYGPIVDQTPLNRPSASPSVATSMLTTTSDNAVDVRTDDGTWLSNSTERADTLGEVSMGNSRDTDKVLGESTEGSAEALKGNALDKVLVETVNSYDDSDDLTDDAYVRVSKEDSSKEKGSGGGDDDGKQSVASDDNFDLKEMHSYAEELAAKASESKQNPFDIAAGHPQLSPHHKVNPDVQDYIAELASGASESPSEKQKHGN